MTARGLKLNWGDEDGGVGEGGGIAWPYDAVGSDGGVGEHKSVLFATTVLLSVMVRGG